MISLSRRNSATFGASLGFWDWLNTHVVMMNFISFSGIVNQGFADADGNSQEITGEE